MSQGQQPTSPQLVCVSTDRRGSSENAGETENETFFSGNIRNHIPDPSAPTERRAWSPTSPFRSDTYVRVTSLWQPEEWLVE